MADETAETTTTTTDVEQAEPTEPTEVTEQEQPGDTGGDDAARARREAKNLRDRLRATEGERDGIASRLETMQRAEVARLAADSLARGGDLLEIGGLALADLLGEHGDVDPTRVSAAVERLTTDRGYLRRRRFQGSADNGAGLGPAAPATPAPTWSDALARR